MISALLSGIGLAAPAGLNAYIPLMVLALADRFSESLTLDEPYDILSSNLGIIVVLTLLTVELVADKIPGVDHVNDLIQTAIRPTAGAFLMMASTSADESVEISPAISLVLGLLTAGTVHGLKAAARPAVTVTTGGVGNPIVSMVEDAVAAIASIVAILVPILIALLIPVLAWLLWRTYVRLRRSGQSLRRLGGRP